MHTRIAAVIKHSGLTMAAFGQRIGLSQPRISAFVNGKATPSDRTIADICREFNVSEQWLRTGEGEMLALPDAAAELANFCADVLTGVSGPSVQRLVSLLAGCSAEEIAVLDRLLDRVAAEWQKEKDTD